MAVRVPNESGYHHCNWTSRLRMSRTPEQAKKRTALSEELDRLQGAGHFYKKDNGHLYLHVHGDCAACGTPPYKWEANHMWGRFADNMRNLVALHDLLFGPLM